MHCVFLVSLNIVEVLELHESKNSKQQHQHCIPVSRWKLSKCRKDHMHLIWAPVECAYARRMWTLQNHPWVPITCLSAFDFFQSRPFWHFNVLNLLTQNKIEFHRPVDGGRSLDGCLRHALHFKMSQTNWYWLVSVQITWVPCNKQLTLMIAQEAGLVFGQNQWFPAWVSICLVFLA